MPTSLSLEEFDALVQMGPAELEELVGIGLLDPEKTGRFDDLDLLRLMAVRHWGALGSNPERLAEAISAGEVEPFLSDYIYPHGPQVTIEEAAEQTGIDLDVLRELRTALGYSCTKFLECLRDFLNQTQTAA